MAELALASRAAPLIAAMLAGCGGPPVVQATNNVVTPPKAEPTPTERAETLVRERLNAHTVSFENAQVFTSQGATVVCGRYRIAGRPGQRFIAVGEEDVFVEGEWSGDMDQAVRETCRDA